MAKSKKVSPRKVPILNIYPIDGVPPEAISESLQLMSFIYTETPKAVQEAIRTNKQVATLFEINNQDVYLEIKKEDWEKAIDKCIAFYSEKEKYEICTNLQNIKASINKSKKELA
jgi:hypothetical protein